MMRKTCVAGCFCCRGKWRTRWALQRCAACCVRGKRQCIDIWLFACFFLCLEFFLGLTAQCLNEPHNGGKRVLSNLCPGNRTNGAKERTQRTPAQTTSSRKTCGLQYRRRNSSYSGRNLFKRFARSRTVLALLKRGGNLLGVKPGLVFFLEFFLASNACLGSLSSVPPSGLQAPYAQGSAGWPPHP